MDKKNESNTGVIVKQELDNSKMDNIDTSAKVDTALNESKSENPSPIKLEKTAGDDIIDERQDSDKVNLHSLVCLLTFYSRIIVPFSDLL